MTDLSHPLAQGNAIRAQVARGAPFSGYGLGSIATGGLLASVAAAEAF